MSERYKADKSVETFEYYDGPDEHGRWGYLHYWWSEGYHLGPAWRVQVYKTRPGPAIALARAVGRTVREVDRRGRK